MIKRLAVIAAIFALSAAGNAQTLRDVRVDPGSIRAGDTAKIMVNFDAEGGINCGMRLHFGDGTHVDYKINQQKDLALAIPRAYAKPGDYQIMAEPKTVGVLLKCSGKNQTALLKVTSGTAAGKPAAKADARCPAGWTLDSKSAKKKDGSFTCTAAPGTNPTGKLTCPGDLSYFENARKGVMGCRP